MKSCARDSCLLYEQVVMMFWYVQVGQVVVVGEIVEVIESQTNISYKIDDRTGPLIEVRRWINEEVCLYM